MNASSRVLVSRPGGRARLLRSALEAQGAEVVSLEAMQLEALAETPAMRQAWLDFDRYHGVVVVSPFAAECLAEGLDRYWPQLPQGTVYYTVGAGTAEVLKDRLEIQAQLPASDQADTSEALLQLPALQHVDDRRMLLVAGMGGRTLLSETLARRGAKLARLEVYRRVLVPPVEPGAGYLTKGDYAALVVTSGELLEHLAGWCTSAALNQPLIVSSQRLATLAQALGYRYVVVAQGATPCALAVAVADICGLNGADHDDLEKG